MENRDPYDMLHEQLNLEYQRVKDNPIARKRIGAQLNILIEARAKLMMFQTPKPIVLHTNEILDEHEGYGGFSVEQDGRQVIVMPEGRALQLLCEIDNGVNKDRPYALAFEMFPFDKALRMSFKYAMNKVNASINKMCEAALSE